ncbi:hypothetical protein LEN26_007984 [Aphanomyces euteiches]|nr:hypothetical protein AeMF1_021567 [Aphanomyces euteiches]KAH9131021.1 hypothetical protein LEN26_007984 [Aphanomyces euteiches]KAH9189794.1 hypothetical protein AeNC1_008233 [Aphanomyces euteiches]
MWVYAILAILILLLIALIVYLAFVVPLRNPPQPDPAVTIIPELVPTDVFREHLSDSFMEQQLWKCPVCFFSNAPEKMCCDLCQTVREIKKSKIPIWTPFFQKKEEPSSRNRSKSEDLRQLNKVQLAAARRHIWKREPIGNGQERWVRVKQSSNYQGDTAMLGDSPDTGSRGSRGSSLASSLASVGYIRVRDSTGRLVLNESDQVAVERLQQTMRRAAPGTSPHDLREVCGLPFLGKVKWFSMAMHRLWVPWEIGHVEFVVRRDHIVEDSFAHIMRLNYDQLRQRWRVRFEGEPALDAGGVFREWLTLLVTELFDPAFGLFVSTASSDHCAWINPNSAAMRGPNHLEYYTLAGRLLGKALLEEQLLPVHLSLPLLKHILGVPISFSDLQFLDDELYQNLLWLRKCTDPDEVASLALDFSVTRNVNHDIDIVPLAPGGDTIAVTLVNKAAYLDLLFQYHILDSVSFQLLMLLGAMYSIVPEDLLKVFDYKELELLLCGVPTIDVEDWKRHAQIVYLQNDAPTRAETQNVTWFWALLESFSMEKRAKLLQFVTGSSRVPAQGFKALISTDGRVQPFKLLFCALDHRYPRAHTCFNRLDLPVYASYADMDTYLSAIVAQDTTGFSME